MTDLLSISSSADALQGLSGLVPALALKGSLVVLVGWLAARALSASTPGARHLVWTATLAGLLMMPFVLALGPAVPVKILPRSTVTLSAAGAETSDGRRSDKGGAAVDPVATRPRDTGEASARIDPLRLIGWAYVLGLLRSLTYFGAGLVGAWRLSRTAEPVAEPDEWRDLLSSPRRTPRLSREPVLLSSAAVTTPFTLGLFRPRVVVPPAAGSWSTQDRHRALLHELAHIDRWDWATRILGHLVGALYWFHPLVWLAVRRQALEAERACDDLVVASGGEARDYARQLLRLASRPSLTAFPARGTVSMATPGELRRRIHSILDSRRRRSSMKPLPRRLLFLSACIPALLIAPLHLVSVRAQGAEGTAVHSSPSVLDEGLLEAARGGDLAGATELLEAGANADQTIPGDGNALIEAARAGDVEMLELLLSWGANVDAAVDGDGSPLIAAAGAGHLDAVRLLLESGADIDRIVPGDENPLIQAAAAGEVEVVRYLIEQGAQVDVRVVANGSEVRTPLLQAQRNGHDDVVEILLAAGAGR